MPQTNMSYVAKGPTNANAPLTVDANGNLFVGSGSVGKYNVTAATVIKATPGRLVKIVVNTSPSTAVSANDCSTTGAAAATNLIFTSPTAPAAGTVYSIDWPCATGIVVNPGTAGVVSVSFD